MAIPTNAGPDTICECSHWYEEHQDWDNGEPSGPALDCGAPGCSCTTFVFSAAETSPGAIADRGGDPERWPPWLKDHLAQ